MKLYLLFFVLAAVTVASPGPGVVMTLSNALRYGFRTTLGGILGIACGAFVVAGVSATSLGAVLAASATAFTILKCVGACYLVYLGVRLWRAPPFRFAQRAGDDLSFIRRFAEGLTLQLTNPKAIFFFMSVYPQFIVSDDPYVPQFVVLVLTYSLLVVAIHCVYALFASRARGWLTSERGARLVNRTAGTTFIAFGAALASARR